MSSQVPALQDTTVVTFASDGFVAFASWALGGLLLAFLVLVALVVLILAEVRKLSAAWTELLATTSARSESLLVSVTKTARNVEKVSGTIRDEVDRLGMSLGGFTDGIEQAAIQMQGRLKELLALVDLAQAEAEDAVLDAAAGVRALRANPTGTLISQLGRAFRTDSARKDGPPRPDGTSETMKPPENEEPPKADSDRVASAGSNPPTHG